AEAIAALADSVADRHVPVERLVTSRRGDLAALAEIAGRESSLAAGPDELRESIAGEIRRLQGEVRRLQDELAAERAVGRRLVRRAEDLQAELDQLTARYAETASDLRDRERRAERLREVQALFSAEEGEVAVSGNQVVLRLPGLAFASGRHEVLPAQEPILTKVARVITEFPGADVRIEGHTDSRGNDEANRALSQRRAIAVRDYLLARIAISADRLETVGLGEARPIASNDTDEGRTRNRRIEIVLTLPAP
ncbi:MAG: OmpA family protein, partial [Gemmatimonadota bacterium]